MVGGASQGWRLSCIGSISIWPLLKDVMLLIDSALGGTEHKMGYPQDPGSTICQAQGVSMFTQRNPSTGIIYVTNGPALKRQVVNGDSVSLRRGDQTVFVRDVVAVSSDRFTGTVQGFEPSFAVEYDGLKTGQQIVFGECHIFGCTSA